MTCGKVERDAPGFPGINTGGSIGGAWLRPLPGADRVFRVSGLASIAAAGTGTAVPITWMFDCVVIAFYGHAVSTAALSGTDSGLASLAVKLTVGDGNEDVITSGSSGDFASLMCLHGRSFQPFPIMREVRQSELWTIQFKNLSTDTAFVPEACLWFRRKGRAAGRSETERMQRASRRG